MVGMRSVTAVALAALAGVTIGAVRGSAAPAGCCEGEYAYAPTWLPDGRTILFAMRTPGGGGAAIETVAVDSPSGVTPLAGWPVSLDEAVAHQPSVAIDGTVVFVGGDWNAPELATMHADGSGKRLLGIPADDRVPIAVTPDGTRVAFDRPIEDGKDATLAVANLRTRAVTVVGAGVQPAWSPDGGRLAFLRGDDIWVARPDGSAAHDVSREKGQEASPTWSPDGRRLAFENEQAYRVDGVDPDTGAHLFSYRGTAPAFSHDGGLLALAVSPSPDFDESELRVVELDQGSERSLGVLATGPVAFSPDDSRLAFVQANNNGSGLAVIPVEGGTPRGLVDACLPDGAPPLIGCSRFGGYSVPFASGTPPFELAAWNQSGRPPGPVNIQVTLHDANGYRVRGAHVTLRTLPIAAAAKPVVGGQTYFDGQLPLRISLRTRRLAKVRFVFTLLDERGHVVVRETYTCHALRIAAARGCPRR